MALFAHTPWVSLGLQSALGLLCFGRRGHAPCAGGAKMGDVEIEVADPQVSPRAREVARFV